MKKEKTTTQGEAELIRAVIKAFGVKKAIKRISAFQSIEKRKRKLQKELNKLNSLV